MRNKQQRIVKQWLVFAFCLVTFVIVNHFSSQNETILTIALISLVITILICLFIQANNTYKISVADTLSLSSQAELQKVMQKPIVVIYYGVMTTACILIASEAANTGVNPFESFGINFIFIGVLILFAPLVIWRERKRFIEAGRTP